MHIHILGICGTFMGGIAQIAKQLGHQVTGSDQNVYPPMSIQLEQAGIEVTQGFAPIQLDCQPDIVVVGNAMTRGEKYPVVEAVLNRGLRYTSGPQWLAEQILHGRWVLAVAGTHGKTTTASMLAWILEYAGLKPGFLIGGVPLDFGLSARLGESDFFVVEADEYDTAFFDKRSKFVHYHPRTLVMNNLEFDHADIFDDLAQIKRQFHHLVRTVPGEGLIVSPATDGNLNAVLELGCWTPVEKIGVDQNDCWSAYPLLDDGSEFTVKQQDKIIGQVNWKHTGRHNLANGLAAIVAARHAGVAPEVGIEALCQFQGVKRRMELRGEVQNIKVYDDFAHHPTAIETTLAGLRAQVGDSRIIAILEPRSNTMRLGKHADQLPEALRLADQVLLFSPAQLAWDAQAVMQPIADKTLVFGEVQQLIDEISRISCPNDHLLVMSNGAFEGIHQRLLDALATKYEVSS